MNEQFLTTNEKSSSLEQSVLTFNHLVPDMDLDDHIQTIKTMYIESTPFKKDDNDQIQGIN